MDHTSELESMAAHHQHVNSDDEEDMLLEELDLKDLKQISLASLDHAGDYRPLNESLVVRSKIQILGSYLLGLLSNRSSKTGHLSSSSHTRDVSLEGRDHHNKNRTSMQKASSWITVVTFSGWLLLSSYRPYSSLCNEQRSFFSIWLLFMLWMLNFTALLSSLCLMATCGAHITRLQSSLLYFSFLACLLLDNK